ncbi:hypothetical protein SAMN05660845_0092 [Flavobacterium swingsii]|jgi:hypothetical protein|uniref:Uncharacterized protein n=1 Tax=Flavobacterium swingsii TaxID=498292 RepID=A0A1I0V0K8_9FLAO|nr:hypothetical protein [Flavobacterium swingsii]SFA69848.1 hypothetical protein SAMN05660845_0092 [Flavobacterium swingsii]
MKTTILKSILALFLVTTSLVSCNDNDDVSPPPPPPGLPEFLYAEGGAPSMSTVTTPYANASSGSIFGVNTGTTVIEIDLPSLVIGVYPINATNTFTYFKPGTAITWTGFTGNVTITRNDDNKLSGTFDINSGNGSPMINEVHGSFTNLVINP